LAQNVHLREIARRLGRAASTISREIHRNAASRSRGFDYSEAAARLARAALLFSRPVDEDHKHFWELGLRVQLVIPPPLAFGALSLDATTITEARRKKILDGSLGALRQAWRTIRFRLGYLAHLHWNRLFRRAR
jgi:hypothetical protein